MGKFYQYRNDKEYLKEALAIGADKASVYASKKMEVVKEKEGLKIYGNKIVPFYNINIFCNKKLLLKIFFMI